MGMGVLVFAAVCKAEAPAGVGKDKYDDTSACMMVLLKYGSGLPFYRLQRLQGSLGIPLPVATQWEIVAEMAEVVQPAYDELIRQACLRAPHRRAARGGGATGQ